MAKHKILLAKPKKVGRWEIVHNIPIFSTDAEFAGKKVDRDMLHKIVRRMKQFGPASVVIGHTSDDDKEEKEAVGLATNFRILDDDKEEKTYLVCDIIIRDSDILNKYPRRSIELWSDYTVDPIALLGSSTPRLDLPVVIKYRREPVMSNEELKKLAEQVLELLQQTAEWKFLRELLEEWEEFQTTLQAQEDKPTEEPEKHQKEQDEEEKVALEDEDLEEKTDVKEQEADEDQKEAEEKDAEEEMDEESLDELLKLFEEEDKEADKSEDKEKEEYQSPFEVFVPGMVGGQQNVGLAGTRGKPAGRPTGVAGNYSRNRRSDSLSELQRLREENRKLKELYRREKRASILRKLAADGYDLDVEEELRYAEKLNDSQFVEHLNRIRTRYRRAPTFPINENFLGGNQVITEELRNKAIEYAYNHGISFEEALKKIQS